MAVKQWVRDTFGAHRVRRIKAIRTRVACKFDVGPWRRPGLDAIDVRLAEAFSWVQGGTFIELGGNDGLQFSNTLMLERELGWRGVLIEGIPELAAEAVRNRPAATVICAAATSEANSGIITMNNDDLVSKISHARGPVCVASTTLATVIEDVLEGVAPDFLVIDVEGFELEVLAGLDLERHKPRWILVETNHKDDVGAVLVGYELVSQLSYHDYLYKLPPDSGGTIAPVMSA